MRTLTESRWAEVKARYPMGSIATGVVVHVEPFGVFVELESDVLAVLEVVSFEDGPRGFQLEEYPPVGTPIRAVVVDQVNSNTQIQLSTRASHMAKAQ